MALNFKRIGGGLIFYAIGVFWCTVAGVSTLLKTLLGGRKAIGKFFDEKDHSQLPEAASAVNVQHDFVRTKSGMRFEYVHAGEVEKPLMLCMHGFPECWYSWRHILSKFSDRYHVVAFHSRGYGNSDKPEGIGKYHLDYLVNDVAEIIEALGYPKATLVAHDWGGAIAWRVPILFPHCVDKVIIMNCPNEEGVSTKISFKQFMRSWYIFMFQLPYFAELFIRSNDFGSIGASFNGKKLGIKNERNKLSREEIDIYKHYTGRNIKYAINYYRACNPIYCGLGLKPKTRKIVHPVLLIWGDQDTALGLELAEGSVAAGTDITLKVIPGSSHWVMQDEPELVHQEMEKFLKENE